MELEERTGAGRMLSRAAWVSGRLLLVAAAVVAAAWFVGRLSLVFLPVAVSLLAASVLSLPVRWLQAKGMQRSLAALLVVMLAVAAVGLVFALLVPQVAEQVSQHAGDLSKRGRELAQVLKGKVPGSARLFDHPGEKAGQMLQERAGDIAGGAIVTAAALLKGLGGALLALVLLFFFLRDGERMVEWLLARWTPPAYRADLRAVGERAWVTLQGYLRGLVIIAAVEGVVIGVGLMLIGVPLALPLALLTFLAAFVPVLGATVAGLVSVLVALLSGGVTDALLVLGLVLAIQQLDSNLLEPFIMGRSVPLHPVAVLLAITAGGVLAGIPGALLAVPLTAVASAAGHTLRLRHHPEARRAEARETEPPQRGHGTRHWRDVLRPRPS